MQGLILVGVCYFRYLGDDKHDSGMAGVIDKACEMLEHYTVVSNTIQKDFTPVSYHGNNNFILHLNSHTINVVNKSVQVTE